MPGHVFLEGDALSLRTVEESDYDLLGRIRNEPEFRTPLGFDTPWSRERVASFFEERDPETSVNLVACSDEGAIGGVDLFEIDRVGGTLSYWLVADHRGSGLATEAVSLVLDYAFEQLGLHRVGAQAFERNDPSRRLLERLGFVREGVDRESRLAEGDYRDVHRYGLLADEWNGVADGDRKRGADEAPMSEESVDEGAVIDGERGDRA